MKPCPSKCRPLNSASTAKNRCILSSSPGHGLFAREPTEILQSGRMNFFSIREGRLKVQLQRKLYFPRNALERVRRPGGCYRSGARSADSRTRVIELRSIGQVERLG